MSATMTTTLADALTSDAADPLSALRSQFCLPRDSKGEPAIYLCGHSLGLATRSALASVQQELADWSALGVNGHHAARRPWIEYAELARQGLAAITRAAPQDLVAMNSLTVNLHLMMASFYRPTATRRKVLVEAGSFSSDRHAISGQIRWHGLDPVQDLIELAPRPGEDLLRDEDIEAAIERAGGDLALVMWPGVQFRTGQAFDCARIAQAAHRVGALAGFDHAHAIGNIALDLPGSDADFAVWCSYKYLNAGPGAVGGAYIAPRHQTASTLRLGGWWGHDPATRFQMGPQFLPAPGAAGWAVSNPPVFSTAPLLASLELFTAASMSALRSRSIALTSWLERAVMQRCGEDITLVSPRDPTMRGAMLTLRVGGDPGRSRRLLEELGRRGVVCDRREPDILRMAPAPLYNSFCDVQRAAEQLAESLRVTG